MSDCTQITLNTPGPQGLPSNNGTNGINGVNAYSLLTAPFTMPTEGNIANATVDSNVWIPNGQVLYLQGAGWLEVFGKVGTTVVSLLNLKNTAGSQYLANVAGGTVIPVSSVLAPSGIQGANGTSAPGSLQAANNLSDVLSVANSRNNLGLGSAAQLASTAFCQGANNLSDVANVATARTNLGLGTAATQAIAAFCQTANNLSDVNAAAARVNLGLVIGANVQAWSPLSLLGYGLLGGITGLNLNSATTDTAFTVNATRYRIDRVTIDQASVNMTTATLGLFTAAGGAGTTIAADQSLAALTATTKFKDLVLQAIAGTDDFTTGTLYARCGTPQGVAATANLQLWGWKLS